MKRLFVSLIVFACSVMPALAQEASWDPSSPYPTDIVIGSQSAPVTVVEYASLTCPHCGRFHKETWPEFKERWIDTGKAKLIYRHLPLDQSALAGALTVSCVPNEGQEELLSELFGTVSQWAPEQNLAPAIQKVFGSNVDFNAVLECVAKPGFPEQVMQPATDAVNNGVEATPTFFVNGEKMEGFQTVEKLGKLVNDKLAEEVLQ